MAAKKGDCLFLPKHYSLLAYLYKDSRNTGKVQEIGGKKKNLGIREEIREKKEESFPRPTFFSFLFSLYF